MMFEAVFISDLHLHPDDADITERFICFTEWAAIHTRAVYILGDFFHVWPGDDALDEWSSSISQRLEWLGKQGVAVHFMPGNRDFLLGNHFLSQANASRLTEPAIITLDNKRILLVHGDRYCTRDRSHQWLRFLTRNRIFSWFFLRLSYTLRNRIVTSIRQHSQSNRRKSMSQMDIVAKDMLSHMQRLKVDIVIHGHIHRPGLILHESQAGSCQQYVLSDWDDSPRILCYDETKGLHFDLLRC